MPHKLSQPSANQGSQVILSGIRKTKTPVKPSSSEKLPAIVASPASSTLATKVPPKGSYAALMAEAKAKAAGQQRAKSEVGQIKHQATSKLKLSKTERRKQEEGDKALRAKLGKQAQHNSKVEKVAARLQAKKRLQSSYKGTAKPATAVSSYKGTAGLPSLHRPSAVDAMHKAGKRLKSYDEYLGTDEEDEVDGSDVGDMDDGYGTEASSDMEAGAFDVAEEERKALREAEADDAREFALEKQRKLEKEERKRKLEALAKKRR